MSSTAYCRNRTLSANTSFYYPILLLAPNKRAAMYALYAFCREVDDVVDEESNQELAREQLAFWRADLDRAFANNRPQHPVTKELSSAVKTFSLPTTPFYDIIDGMEMDLNQQRFSNQEELTLYCSKVAVAVGLISTHIFCFNTPENQLSNDRKKLFAHHLGMAFQLTNILRDIKEDAQRGRVYIPLSLLNEYAVSEAELLKGEWSQSLGKALARIGTEAEEHYRAGDRLIVDPEERRCMFPALVMSGIYHRYLTNIAKLGFNTLDRRVKLSTPIKIALTLSIWFRERVF
jgi:15-cis-phytoene synthase